MKHLTSTFIFLLLVLHSLGVHSKTILTVDYFDRYEQNESNIVFSKPILPKASRVNKNASNSFDIDFSIVGDNIPENGIASAHIHFVLKVMGTRILPMENGLLCCCQLMIVILL